jgi:uncharacterized repeat protein (TIGR02543 family)
MKKILLIIWTGIISFSLFSQDICTPMGWATEYGTISGGGSATPVVVTNYSQLASAINNENKVIHISGTINFPNNGRINIQDMSGLTIFGLPGSKLVSSDLTKSGSGIFYIKRVTNFILQNLVFEGPGAYDDDGYDNLCLDDCQGVWVDHCEFHDGMDGNFDIKNKSDYISVTWCTFSYEKPPIAGGSGGSNDHRYTNLIGSSDGATDDRGKLKTTFQYCWWGEGCRERMPRVRYGKIHILNNLFSSSVSNHCIRAAFESNILVEGNYFDNQSTPVDLFTSNAIVAQQNNVSTRSSISTQNAGSVFTPDYSYTVADPNTIPETIRNCAGATITSWGGCSPCSGGASYNPIVNITSPANGNSFATGSTINISASASDVDGNIENVFFYINGEKFQEEWVAPYEFSHIITVPGTYTIRAVATDNDGLTGTSEISINVSSPYTISVNTLGSGIVSPDINGVYYSGDEISVSAIEYIGWQFIGWTGDITSSEKNLSFTVTGNLDLTANFTASASTNTYEMEDGYYESGVADFENNNTGYSGSGYVNTVNALGTWTEITVYAPTNGIYRGELFYASNTDRPVNVSVNGNLQITPLAMPSTGAWTTWESVAFTLELTEGANTIRFISTTADGAPNLDKIVFSANNTETFSLTVNQATGGTIAPSSDIFNEGVSVEISATPSSGYTFANWTGSLSGSENPITLVMDSDKTVSAVFTEISDSYQVNLKAGWNIIGYPLLATVTIDVALANIWDKVICIKNDDGFYLKDQNPILNSLSSLEWAKGYFIKVSEDCGFNWR